MKCRTTPELIIFQAPVAFLDDEAFSGRVDPQAAFLPTQAAVAFCG